MRYPHVYKGNVAGLASRVIQYQDETEQNQRRQQILSQYKPEAPTCLPPIPLPSEPGVTFLRTVGELDQEGTAMHHCALSYARAAVLGESFLFHIEYMDEKATVEVILNGNIVQAKGPRNAINRASEWGSEILRQWAKRLPPPPKKAIDEVRDPNIEYPF